MGYFGQKASGAGYWILAAVAIVIAVILLGMYREHAYGIDWADWTGLHKKTLWDLLELLVVPLTLAMAAYYLSREDRRNENRIAAERAQDVTLQDYLDSMSDLVLNRRLVSSEQDRDIAWENVRRLARIRTLTTLQRLDGARKGLLVRFLYHSELIAAKAPIIDMSGADLTYAELSGGDASGNPGRPSLSYLSLSGVFLAGADLRGANLAEAKLNSANLAMADLTNANLSHAHLMQADLRDATLTNACFREASLLSADLTGSIGATNEQLNQAKTLLDVKFPDEIR